MGMPKGKEEEGNEQWYKKLPEMTISRGDFSIKELNLLEFKYHYMYS